MSTSKSVPGWLFLPLPANAEHDAKLLTAVEQYCAKIPDTFSHLYQSLWKLQALASYEPAVNLANSLIWERFEDLLSVPEGNARLSFARYASSHMPQRALARILRRLAKDPDMSVRTAVVRMI